MASEIETLASSYGLIEGPRVDEHDNLYFSDVTNGGIYRRSPDGTITTVVPKRRGVGGIALHADGGIVVSGRNICHVTISDAEPVSRVVFETDAAGINDVFVDTDGRLLLGTLRSNPFEAQTDRVPGECLRVEPDGTSTTLYGDVAVTNGIGLSPDGQVLYHSDTGNNHIICHDVDGDGVVRRRSIGDARNFFPDGLAVDEAGTVWVADYGNGCVRGLGPDGEEVGVVNVPAVAVTSLCFGGEDRRDLYIVSADNTDDPSEGGSIFRTRVDVPGVPVGKAKI